MVGTIEPNFSSKPICYYGIKAFLKFEDESASLPCIVALDYMNPDIIGSEIVVLEWNFIWSGKRKGLNIAYLEIIKMTSLEVSSVSQSSRIVECLNVGESLMLNSRTILEDNTAPIITNIVGKISAVSEVYGTSTGQECFLAWVEDVEDPNSFVVFSCKPCNFLWLQSWLLQGETYVFENVSPEILKSQRGNAFCFKATEKLTVGLLSSKGVSVKSISSKDVLKTYDQSDASDFDRDGYRLDVHNPDFKGLTSVSGIVTEANYSHFGRFTLNNEIKVYMHMSGNSNFEHVRTGSEVALENVRFSAGLVVGGRMSRLLVKSWTHEESSAEGISSNAREFGLHLDDSKPFRILSELLESCDYMSPRQLENLLGDVGVPRQQFCPDLITKINFKTYKDFFLKAVHKLSAGFDFRELPNFGNSKLVSVPVLHMEPLKKLENFVFGEHNRSIQFGSRSLISQDRYFKFLTIKDLVTIDRENDKFMLFERVQNYWECKIMASCGPEHDTCVLGILKLDEQRACLSLVDSENFIECVVTDIPDELSIHSCFESRSCRLQCRSSPSGSQLAACPYAHAALVDCLIRVDKFFLVSEYFKRDSSLPTEGSPADGYEKRYIVFSAADVVSFGSQMLLEIGISGFPCWPAREDVIKFGKEDFSSSDWTNFSLMPIQDNRFSYECFTLQRLLEGCTDFSFNGLVECLENQKPDVCSCCLSFVFVVQSKDGPIVRVKKPDSKDVDLSKVLENYLKEIETFDAETAAEGETSAGSPHPPDWKNLKSLIPPPNLVNPKDVKFFESKNVYQFGLTGYIAEFRNGVCDFCLKSKNMSRQDPKFQEHFGPMQFKDKSEEVLMVFSENCAGWYPALRPGCIYKVELRRTATVGRQFEPCAKKLQNFIRKKLIHLYGWKYVIEISDNTGVTIKRSYNDWFGSTFQNLPHESNELVDNIKSSYRKLSKSLTFMDEGRIRLGGDFETLVGVVIMKRFNVPKYSTDIQQRPTDSSKSNLFSSMGSSLPGHRNIVITLQLLGSEETVKVSIANNRVYKYSLGVLTGCCICFRHVLRTDFSSTGKRSSTLYSFLSISNLEVLSFPSDPFSPIDGNSITRFNFKNRRIHVAEAESHKEGDQTVTSQQIPMNFENTANLFEYSECQESFDKRHETVASNANLPYQFLRELFYKNNMNNITSNVFIDNVSQVILYYACPRHPDAKKTERMESLCQSCQSDLTTFRASVRLEVCDSTNRSYITCCDDLARKTLNLSEQMWKELGDLVKLLPTKNILWSPAEKTSAEEYGLSSGNEPLFPNIIFLLS